MTKTLDSTCLPSSFSNEDALEEFLTRPNQALIDDLQSLEGDIMVLGISGKMGPTLARLAKRAAPGKTITGVARFTDHSVQQKLADWDIETIKCDLINKDMLAELPKVKNIVFMAGRKFGSSGSEELTWAMNVLCPAMVAEAFPNANIVSFSTACVYPFVPVNSKGASEELALNPPGEYAQSCVGRERMFQYFSKKLGTPGCQLRLSYAIDLRYGVLLDVAKAVLNGEEIDVTMGHANVIWQGDANTQALRALLHCKTPTWALNISGSQITSIRWLAERFGEKLNRPANIVGEEAKTSWLINTSRAQALFGQPTISIEQMIDWVADWVLRGQASLGKPTHFEVRDGNY